MFCAYSVALFTFSDKVALEDDSSYWLFFYTWWDWTWFPKYWKNIKLTRYRVRRIFLSAQWQPSLKVPVLFSQSALYNPRRRRILQYFHPLNRSQLFALLCLACRPHTSTIMTPQPKSIRSSDEFKISNSVWVAIRVAPLSPERRSLYWAPVGVLWISSPIWTLRSTTLRSSLLGTFSHSHLYCHLLALAHCQLVRVWNLFVTSWCAVDKRLWNFMKHGECLSMKRM